LINNHTSAAEQLTKRHLNFACRPQAGAVCKNVTSRNDWVSFKKPCQGHLNLWRTQAGTRINLPGGRLLRLKREAFCLGLYIFRSKIKAPPFGQREPAWVGQGVPTERSECWDGGFDHNTILSINESTLLRHANQRINKSTFLRFAAAGTRINQYTIQQFHD
jgi:hypothetical protein